MPVCEISQLSINIKEEIKHKQEKPNHNHIHGKYEFKQPYAPGVVLQRLEDRI